MAQTKLHRFFNAKQANEPNLEGPDKAAQAKTIVCRPEPSSSTLKANKDSRLVKPSEPRSNAVIENPRQRRLRKSSESLPSKKSSCKKTKSEQDTAQVLDSVLGSNVQTLKAKEDCTKRNKRPRTTLASTSSGDTETKQVVILDNVEFSGKSSSRKTSRQKKTESCLPRVEALAEESKAGSTLPSSKSTGKASSLRCSQREITESVLVEHARPGIRKSQTSGKKPEKSVLPSNTSVASKHPRPSNKRKSAPCNPIECIDLIGMPESADEAMAHKRKAFGCLAKRPTRTLKATTKSAAEAHRAAFDSLALKPKPVEIDPVGIKTRDEIFRYLKKGAGVALVHSVRGLLPDAKPGVLLSALTDALFARCYKGADDTMSWAQKYAPKSARAVVRNSNSSSSNIVSCFKKWLEAFSHPGDISDDLTILLESFSTVQSSAGEDDFIAPDYLPDCPLFPVAILVGPVGSGKTSSVYACCEDLGLRVIETNTSQRRCRADIIASIGEATQSHRLSFQSKPNSLVKGDKKCKTLRKASGKARKAAALKQAQVESVILFDDVDVVLNEDRSFYQGIKEISVRSRRPVVLTCTTRPRIAPNLDCYVFDLSTPQRDRQVMKLLSICVAEGLDTLPTSQCLSDLLSFFNNDLRAAINALQMWCDSGSDRVECCQNIGDGVALSCSSVFDEGRLLHRAAGVPLFSAEIFQSQGPSIEQQFALVGQCLSAGLDEFVSLNWPLLFERCGNKPDIGVLEAMAAICEEESFADVTLLVNVSHQEFDDVYSGLVCDVAESLVATRTTLSLGLARVLDQCSASPRLSLLRHEMMELESLQTFARQVYLELELMNVPGPVGGPFSASFLTETLPYLYEFCAIESGIMGGSRDRRGRRVCRRSHIKHVVKSETQDELSERRFSC